MCLTIRESILGEIDAQQDLAGDPEQKHCRESEGKPSDPDRGKSVREIDQPANHRDAPNYTGPSGL
jgi:hypothetical protein